MDAKLKKQATAVLAISPDNSIAKEILEILDGTQEKMKVLTSDMVKLLKEATNGIRWYPVD